MAATSCLFTLLSQERGVRDRRRLEGEQITTVEKKGKRQKKKTHLLLWRRKTRKSESGMARLG